MRPIPRSFVLAAFALVDALLGASCDRLTGVPSLPKSCISDTTYYAKVITPAGRIDSLEVHQTIDRCGR